MILRRNRLLTIAKYYLNPIDCSIEESISERTTFPGSPGKPTTHSNTGEFHNNRRYQSIFDGLINQDVHWNIWLCQNGLLLLVNSDDMREFSDIDNVVFPILRRASTVC